MILEYLPAQKDFKIISMHYFEDEDLKNGRSTLTWLPDLEVDPSRLVFFFFFFLFQKLNHNN